MDVKIACCGLDCSGCGAFKATMANDDEMRKQIAEEWSKLYQSDIDPQTINCMGCNGNGVVFYYPTVCEIRNCVHSKNFETCAECPDYACEKLQAFFEMAPQVRENLEKLRH